MRITLAVGILFLVLAGIFAVTSRHDCRTAGGKRTHGAKTRRRIAMIFACIGATLIAWELLFFMPT